METEFTKTKMRKYFYTADKGSTTEGSGRCYNKENWFEAATEAMLPFAFWGIKGTDETKRMERAEGKLYTTPNLTSSLNSANKQQVLRTQKSVDTDNVTSQNFTLRKYFERTETFFCGILLRL
jgi:hypothetical protein